MITIKTPLLIDLFKSNYIKTTSKGAHLIPKKIETDSRMFETGSFFLPLKGDNFDGHDYLLNVLEKGCSGFIYSKDLNEDVCSLVTKLGILAIQVKDTLKALQQISSYYRSQVKATVIAITGSNGKTTTKDIIVQILSKKYKTVGSKKSFNNHLGVPLTLLTCKKDTEFLVVEIGMNHKGEIEELMNIVRPDVGIVTNVGKAHLGHFNSFDEILSAKGEIVTNIKQDAKLYINQELKNSFPFNQISTYNIKYFGKGQDADLKYSDLVQERNSVKGLITTTQQNCLMEFPGLGVHNFDNLAASCLCLLDYNFSLEEIAQYLKECNLPPMRLQQMVLPNGTNVINDSYNANPVSFQKAIETFIQIKCEGHKVLVVGDMLELGAFSKTEHEKLAQIIKNSNIDNVYTIGSSSRLISEKINNDVISQHFEDKDSLAVFLKDKLNFQDILMLKGSRANQLEKIIEKLENLIEVANV